MRVCMLVTEHKGQGNWEVNPGCISDQPINAALWSNTTAPIRFGQGQVYTLLWKGDGLQEGSEGDRCSNTPLKETPVSGT